MHITAEGQTEQAFSKRVLAPHLASFNVFVDARCVLTSKDNRTGRIFRGGLVSYGKAKQDIKSWLKQEKRPDCRFTTMFDLYALSKDFPGYASFITESDPYKRVRELEKAMAEDIEDLRFLPYIQLHEFEALILAEPQKLDWEYLEHQTSIDKLISMVGGQNPELINDGTATAPSKRILKEIPEYAKATAGVSIAEKIGLPVIRKQCRHFHEWLSHLEQLAT